MTDRAWIPCAEKMPSWALGVVLTYRPEGGGYAECIMTSKLGADPKDPWWDLYEGPNMPTHWMPLPAPPPKLARNKP